MLSFLLITPLLGGIFLLLVPSTNNSILRSIALFFSLLTFFLSTVLIVHFDQTVSDFQFVESLGWLPLLNLSILIGIDGISLWLIVLTTFLIPACLLISWSSVQILVREYLATFLFLEFLLLLVFTVLDLLVFYITFEAVLIPMFIIIGVWGSRGRKVRAAYQLFLYTLIGSVLMLIAILIIYYQAGTTNLLFLLEKDFTFRSQILFWVAFFASFAVKIPMVPFHIWLPEAHVEAPTAGSVILAGILLKLGGYGFLRFSIPLFPSASLYFTPLVYAISLFGVVYASITTLQQTDLKKIIAYSSVAHMNMVTIGLFTRNLQGIEGSIFLMLSHGIVSSALFLCVGLIYERHHTRMVKYYSGLVHTMPLFVITFLLFTLANIGFPGSSSFVGEFLLIVGAFQSDTVVGLWGSTGMIFGGAYSLFLANRICFGNFKLTTLKATKDMTRREFHIFLPFVLLTLILGVYPDFVFRFMHMSIVNII